MREQREVMGEQQGKVTNCGGGNMFSLRNYQGLLYLRRIKECTEHHGVPLIQFDEGSSPQTDRQRDRWTNRYGNRKTDRQTDTGK